MFYLPWYGSKVEPFVCPREIYTIGGKKPALWEADGIHSKKKPFLSMLTPKGTIRQFISALHNKAYEEAKGYISQSLWGYTDMEELGGLFRDTVQYQCYLTKRDKRIVSIAFGGIQDRLEVIFVKVVQEPNAYGKWKIAQIVQG